MNVPIAARNDHQSFLSSCAITILGQSRQRDFALLAPSAGRLRALMGRCRRSRHWLRARAVLCSLQERSIPPSTPTSTEPFGASDVDLSLLPRLEAYLKGLPRGLDSYPDSQSKASAIRQFRRLAGAERPRMPDVLESLFHRPPPVSSWFSTVHLQAFKLALTEHLSEAEFIRTSYEINRELLSGPLYRVLMLVISPRILVNGAASRWAAVHRGNFTAHVEADERSAKIELRYPAYLVTPLLAEGIAAGIQAAIDIAGAKDGKMEVVRADATRAWFRSEWR